MSLYSDPIRFEKRPSLGSPEWFVERINNYFIPFRNTKVAVLTEIEGKTAFLKWENETQSWWIIAFKVTSFIIALFLAPDFLLGMLLFRFGCQLFYGSNLSLLVQEMTLSCWITEIRSDESYRGKSLQLIEKLPPSELSHRKAPLNATPLSIASVRGEVAIALALIRKLPLEGLLDIREMVEEDWGISQEIADAWRARVRYLEDQIPRKTLAIGLAQAETGGAPASSLTRLVRRPDYEPRVFGIVGQFLRSPA